MSETASPQAQPACRHLDRMRSLDYGRLSRALMLEHGPPDWLRKNPIFSSAAHRFQCRSRHNAGGAVWPVHDLLLNDILVWLLPTHGLTLLIKFATVLALLLSILFYGVSGIVQDLIGRIVITPSTNAEDVPSIRPWLKWTLVIMMSSLLVIAWCRYYRRVLDVTLNGKTWMDPTVPAINRLAMHVPLRLFVDEGKAREAACFPDLVAINVEPKRGTPRGSTPLTPNVWRLDGLNWKFCLKDTAEEGLQLVEQQQQEVEWAPITVPSNWTLQGFKDKPIYTNQKYPWPCQPPLVPHQNPTGVYRLDFVFPTEWQSDDSQDLLSDFTLLLHGVESACYVYMNHQFVGFSKDSRLPCEFDVTPVLKKAKNLLEIVVMRWSDGSYVEAQDQWWMAGIHRSVELIRRSPNADILDYAIQADSSGHLNCSIDLRPQIWRRGESSHRRLRMHLYNDLQRSAEGDWEKGALVLSSEQVLDADQTNVTFSEDLDRSLLQLWTAETPFLYTLTLLLVEDADSSGVHTGQVESSRVGFRTVDIHDGAVHVNGRPITVCGINRHEHDPDFGKVVSLERMKQDVCLLK